MRIKSILTAAAIALVPGVGSAASDEISGSSGGFTEFHTLAGVQTVPLDTTEMASISASHWVKQKVNKDGTITADAILIKTNGIWNETEDEQDRDDGVKFFGPGAGGTNFVALNDPDAPYYTTHMDLLNVHNSVEVP